MFRRFRPLLTHKYKLIHIGVLPLSLYQPWTRLRFQGSNTEINRARVECIQALTTLSCLLNRPHRIEAKSHLKRFMIIARPFTMGVRCAGIFLHEMLACLPSAALALGKTISTASGPCNVSIRSRESQILDSMQRHTYVHNSRCTITA